MSRGKRDRVVRLLASPAEIRAWRETADAADRTLSAWIRDLCNEKTRAQTTEHKESS